MNNEIAILLFIAVAVCFIGHRVEIKLSEILDELRRRP